MINPGRCIRTLLHRRRLDREMRAEMQAHLDALTQENIAAGMAPEEARLAAQRRFGGTDQIRERALDARGGRWLEEIERDVRVAVRSLSKSPLLTAIAILSLAIGIGAGTAVFSVLNAVLLRDLPVRDPGELRVIQWSGLHAKLLNHTGFGFSTGAGGVRIDGSFPYPALDAFRSGQSGLASIFAFFAMPRVTVVAAGESTTTAGVLVSGNFLHDYGATVHLGRALTADDDRPGTEPVAVITHRFWQQRFGGAADVLGQTIVLNRNPFTIVGVLSPGYVGPFPGDPTEFYVTFAAQPALAPARALDSLDQWWVQLMARVEPEANLARSAEVLTAGFHHLLENSRATIEQPGIVLTPGAQGAGTSLRRRLAKPMFLLLGVVAVVVAVACANVAGLLLARGSARRHEFALRAALGSGRWRLIRQTLVESAVLAVAAACLGLVFSIWSRSALLRGIGIFPEGFHFDLTADRSVFGFALATAVITAVLFGTVPALRAGFVEPLGGLKSRSAAGAPPLRLAKVLVSVQIGLTVLLVVGAGLLARSFVNLTRLDPGFTTHDLLTFRIDPGQAGYDRASLPAFYREAHRALAALPGVDSVAMTSVALASDSSNTNTILLPESAGFGHEPQNVHELHVSEDFFATMRIPILLGRGLSAADSAESMPVAVVNETFVRRFFPAENALGQTFRLSHAQDRAFTIVGVSRDAKYASLRQEIPPLVCFSRAQEERNTAVVLIRSSLPPLSLVPAARKAIASINRNVPLSNIATQEQLVQRTMAADRLFAVLCGGLSGFTLLLACIGIFGLLAYSVSQRTQEIGVRMALGATRRAVAWPLMRQALLLTALGLAGGIPASVVAARVIRNQLYGVELFDSWTLGAGAVLVLVVVLAASWLPARRATRIDPMVALRME